MDTRQQKNQTVSPDEWYTPRWIIDTLGPFDLDPCAPPADVRPYEIAPTAYTRDDDGLSREWHGTVWMNPPYSRVPLRRFCERMAAHGGGGRGHQERLSDNDCESPRRASWHLALLCLLYFQANQKSTL